jgi:hypothetical protein
MGQNVSFHRYRQETAMMAAPTATRRRVAVGGEERERPRPA